jgi:two-component sensor histidine kinase
LKQLDLQPMSVWPGSAATPANPSSGRSGWSPRRAVATLGGGLVLVAMILFGGLAYGRWHATVNEAEQLTENLSDLLAEHAGRVFDAGNLVADQAIMLARDREWDEVAQSREAFRHLMRIGGGFEYIAAVWLVDETGMPRLATRSFPAPAVSVADREHFQHQRAADVGPVISRLLQSRVTGETNIVMSRRIESERGEFRGAALIVIDPGYFQAFYRSIKGPYPVAVDLFRSDLAVIIHHPEIAPSEALQLTKWPDRAERLALGESGTIYRARSPVDGKEWLESYERIKGFSFYVGVGIPRAAIFERWLEGTLQQGIFAGAALAGLLLLVAVAITQTGREELARSELETLNQTLEERVRERTSEVERSAEGLRRLLAEKDVLFREVHHRVKNNLQIISSLLNLYSTKFAGDEVQRSFTDCLNQVRAMGLVHELLYRTPNVARIDFDEYLRVLASRFVIFFGRGGQVRLNIRSAPLHFDLDTTIPLALIVTEAITNAFKHAFPGNRSGTINVEVTQAGGTTTLLVSDDGVGLPPDWERLQTRSLGLKLLGVLAEQINARLTYRSDRGTTIELVIDQTGEGARGDIKSLETAGG